MPENDVVTTARELDAEGDHRLDVATCAGGHECNAHGDDPPRPTTCPRGHPSRRGRVSTCRLFILPAHAALTMVRVSSESSRTTVVLRDVRGRRASGPLGDRTRTDQPDCLDRWIGELAWSVAPGARRNEGDSGSPCSSRLAVTPIFRRATGGNAYDMDVAIQEMARPAGIAKSSGITALDKETHSIEDPFLRRGIEVQIKQMEIEGLLAIRNGTSSRFVRTRRGRSRCGAYGIASLGTSTQDAARVGPSQPREKALEASGPTEEVALAVLDTEAHQHVELSGSFDAFGYDPCSGLVAEGDEGLREGPSDGIAIDAGRKLAVELDDLRGKLQHE